MSGELRIGIIGFDTSHVPAFTRLLNDAKDPFHVPGGRVVAGFPSFSKDLEASYSRVDGFISDVSGPYGVEIVGSAEALVDKVDAVLLGSVDGRRHLAEIRPVLAARKPVYVDKPLAAPTARRRRSPAWRPNTAVRSFPPLRSADANIVAAKEDPGLGKVLACDAFSPAKLDPTNLACSGTASTAWRFFTPSWAPAARACTPTRATPTT